MEHDLNLLQGTWRIASLEVDGAAVPAGGATITLAGNRFTTMAMGHEYSGCMELDSTTEPKQLSMHFESGPEAGNSNRGIYEVLEGGVQWRLCLNLTGGAAPTGFATHAGSGYALETLVRGDSHIIRLENSAREPIAELQGEWAMVSCVRSGSALPASMASAGRRRVEGVQSTLHFGPQLFMQGLLSRDEGAPHWIRLEHTAGETAGKVQLGIFQRDGDALQTCFGPPDGQTRPTAYGSSKAGGETYAVWTRLR